MLRAILILILTLGLPAAGIAQQGAPGPGAANAPDSRSATGGATTLEDILARQRGERVDDSYRRNNIGGTAGTVPQLEVLGRASDSDIYRALRFGVADVTTSVRGPAAEVLIQDGGIWWLEFRRGPLAGWGAWLLGGMLVLLALFYLLRGRIRIDGEKTGRKILRFSSLERFGHWLFAGSFLVLAATGLISLFGRKVLIPVFGPETFSTIALAGKWVHNNVAWAFMLGLAIIIVNWTLQNLPDRNDLKWLAVGGGLFSRNLHPPAHKFNAGQKLIFWGCVGMGLVISLTGLSLLFPFQLPMFAGIFGFLNSWGISGLLGLGTLPDTLAPHQEMQFAQVVHASVAFVFIAMIFAHIYLGSVGMEGAFDAMASGEVEEQWAREHHGLWLDEVRAREAGDDDAASPAK